MKKNTAAAVVMLLLSFPSLNAENTSYDVQSPDSTIRVHIVAGPKLQWSVEHKGQHIIAPSAMSLQMERGIALGDSATVISGKTETIDDMILAINYKKKRVRNHCNQLTITCRDDFGIVFRVFNDGVAYRFFTTKGGDIFIKNEEAVFNFTDDHTAFIPYMWDYRSGKIFNSSFEALYRETRISEFSTDSLAFLPLLVDIGHGKKVALLEADLEDYPGMYVHVNSTRKGFMGAYAPYPLEAQLEGHSGINYIPTKRADYIARTKGPRTFPWRAIVISQDDKDLLDNDMVQKLASPPALEDVSWIKPGQVAWDWWNDWNISHVDFRAGINTATYKYYIDFASANRIPYIIMDAGWSDRLDLTKVVPEINLDEIISHGKARGVGVILWATWYATMKQMDKVFPLYSGMGIKGFKVDFFDRDDQKAVASTYEIAKKAAEHELVVDYHGIFKPTGLQRTYPNVLGYEGVRGLENVKWAIEDAPRYDVSIPFIRMLAGPMDYTPGAMRNAARENFRPVYSHPMSQGTRCHQLAMYVVYEAPLQMLSDSPTEYSREQECTDFITRVPTTFDETLALDGKVGEYAAVARRNGDTWYVAAMSNWNARDLTIDCSFLGEGTYNAVVFSDGVNANRDATDYRRATARVSSRDTLNVHLAPGGGWAARLERSGK